MLGCECFCWESESDFYSSEPEPFHLPAALPEWPQGMSLQTNSSQFFETLENFFWEVDLWVLFSILSLLIFLPRFGDYERGRFDFVT